MKRLVGFIFIALLLCNGISAGQTKTDSGNDSNATPPVAEQQDSADKAPNPVQKQTNVENQDAVGDQSSPVIKRISELAKKTNFTLAVSIIATGIAFASWLAGRDSVAVTRDIGQKQTRAYLNAHRVEIDTQFGVWVSIFLKNSGNSPARNIKIEAICCRATYNVIGNGKILETKWFTDSIERRHFPDIESGMTKKVSANFIYGHNAICEIMDEPAQSLSMFTTEFVMTYTDVFDQTYTVPVSLMSTSFEYPSETDIVLDQVAITPTIDGLWEQAKNYKDNKAGKAVMKMLNEPKHRSSPET